MLAVHLTTVHPATDNRIANKEVASLLENGITTVLVAQATDEDAKDDPHYVPLPVYNGRLSRVLRGYKDAWGCLTSLQPDILHIHDPELIPLALAWRLTHRCKAVYDAHEDLPLQISQAKTYLPRAIRPPLRLAGRLIERLAERGMDGVVVATPRLAQNYSAPNLALVQNFPLKDDFPEPADYPQGTRKAIYVGAIAAVRGSVEMVRAVELASGVELELVGTARDDVSRNAISSAGPGVAHLGPLPPKDIPSRIAGANVGLAILHPVPSYLEAQATKLYEYMAAGRPFVASNFPAWRRQLEHYEAGIFVDPLDARAVADAVQWLVSHPLEAAAMGARGRKAFEEAFNFDHEAQTLIDVYRALSAYPSQA